MKNFILSLVFIFGANALFAQTCQDYTVDFGSTPITDLDSMWIDVCEGTELEIEVSGNFPNNNVAYYQDDDNLTYQWRIDHGSTNVYNQTQQGLNSLSYEFDQPGGYFVFVETYDTNGCPADNELSLRVRVPVPPNFDGTHIAQDSVCPEDVVNLHGFDSPNSWSLELQDEVAGVTFLPDGSGVSYSTSITNNVFSSSATVTSIGDIQGICVNMEHSYMGDLDMSIICPNGQTMEIFDQGGGGTIIGEPVATNLPVDGNSTDETPGNGYDYCWSPFSTNGPIDDSDNWNNVSPYTDPIGNVSSGTVNQLISGDYEIDGDWADLIGCPLNGSWTINITDNLGADNGYIFSWQMIFDQSYIPDSFWTIENEFDLNDSYWTGENIVSDVGGAAIAQPTTVGESEYTFHLVDDFGCVYDTTLSVIVRAEDDPLCCTDPTATVGPDDEICSDTYQLSCVLFDPINTVTWSLVSGPGNANFNGQENSTNPTVTVDTYGVYVFQVVEQNLSPSCTDTATVEITFHETPRPTFTASAIDCYGDPTIVNYVGNATAAATYTWDFHGGTAVGTGQGPIEVTWPDTGLHSISLSVEENECVSYDTTINVTHPEELTHTLTYENDPCFNACDASAHVDVQGGTLPYTYSWGPNSTAQNLCAGDYGLTVTDNNGCEVTDNFTITEPPEIVINSITTQDISCFNESDGEIIVDASGGTGNLTYEWADGATGSSRYNLVAGNYSLTITDENGCFIQQTITIIQPNQLLATISPNQAHCEGETSNITGNVIGGTGPYTYYWNSGSGFVADANVISVSPDETTTYIMYVEDANGCVSPQVNTTLTISPLMTMELTTQDNRCFESCDGEAQLQVDGGIPPFDYSWASTGSVNSNLCAGTYNVTVTDVLGCEVDTVFHISQPAEMFGNVYTREASCYGYDDGRAIIEVVGGVPSYSYLWPNGSQNDTVNLPAGTYDVTVTDANNCRLNVDAEVGQPDQLRAQLVGGDRWICKTNTTQLNAQAIGGSPYYDFYWSGSDGSEYIIRDPQVSPETTTTYELTVVDSHGCSSNTPDITVNIYPDLEISYVSTGYDSICPGDPAIVEVDVAGGNGGPYSLTLQNGQVVPAPFTVYPDETTNYIITLNDACGSPSVQDSIEIVVLPEPGNSFTSDKVEGCPPLNVKFNEVSENIGQTYLWSFGDNGFAYTKNPNHVYQEGGQFDVSLTVTSPHGCKKTRTVENMINVYPKPFADFYTDNNYVSVLDPEVQFFNLSEGADSTYWFFGDGDSSHFHNPSHNFRELGEYQVHLIVESGRGCFDTVTKMINVRDEFTFYTPNAFTPNGDGDNDFFMVYGNGIDKNEFNLVIYDRWGELIFETDVYDPDRPMESAWDGTYNGNHAKGDRLLSNGVYYWYCRFKDFTGVWHEEEGTITLIR